jgi:hypothetical protein
LKPLHVNKELNPRDLAGTCHLDGAL